MRYVAALPLPPTCFACGEPLNFKEDLGTCSACWPLLPRWNLQNPPPPPLPPEIDNFYAPFLYEGVIKEAISAFKFYDSPELAKPFAQLVDMSQLSGGELLVPVPVHKWRLLRRQFNQSALLAQALGQKTGLEVDLLNLQRVKHTPHQLGKSAKARRRLLAGAFNINKNVFSGRDVVLVDDVWTTGSTAAACAKVLKKAGAKSVQVCTIAYVEI